MCYYSSAINRVQCSGLKRITKKHRKRESYCLSWESKSKSRYNYLWILFKHQVQNKWFYIWTMVHKKNFFLKHTRIVFDCQLSIRGGKLDLMTKEHRFVSHSYTVPGHTHTFEWASPFLFKLVLFCWVHILEVM